MKVLIISGGTSSERKISLISASQVKTALEQKGHIAKIYDLRKGFKPLEKLLTKFDVVFPVLHGEEGEGGELQRFLANSGKIYVGGSPDGFKEGWFKISFKKFCNRNNIPTAKWAKVKNEQDVAKFGFPCVLKTSNGGSSKEVVILKSAAQLKSKQAQALFDLGFDLMVEEYLKGIEITVGVLGHQALPVIEIVPPKGGWFDYENKYTGKTQEIVGAPSLAPGLQKRCQNIALKIHQILQLGPFSRTDSIIVGDIPYALEVNVIPGITPESLYPKAAKAIGLDYPAMIEQLIILSKNPQI